MFGIRKPVDKNKYLKTRKYTTCYKYIRIIVPYINKKKMVLFTQLIKH